MHRTRPASPSRSASSAAPSTRTRPRRDADTAASPAADVARSPRLAGFLRIYVSFFPHPSARPPAGRSARRTFRPYPKLVPAPLCDARGMHDSDVVPRVRPSGSRTEPRVAWIRARVRVTAARCAPRFAARLSPLLSPRLGQTAARLAEAELPRSPSPLSPILSLPPIAARLRSAPLRIFSRLKL
ncbi:hypothetical protein GQ55_5G217100 [Panicum hallii var. hallii]|uniref:Uncharacterized protein n=1 Tax=Panicum hallii var. hallii TaxID=1504633 RepID=A0A2T7DIU3_9POAL|nr:hypothetical protein GQ55_5G217100 [Panicum hallii var. hallii]